MKTNRIDPKLENAMIRLIMKQKYLIAQIAKLEHRLFIDNIRLQEVNEKIKLVKYNISSLQASIQAAGEGMVKEKLINWKTKEENSLFKMELRLRKIDVCKMVVNQSKLGQAKVALTEIEKFIKKLFVPESESQASEKPTNPVDENGKISDLFIEAGNSINTSLIENEIYILEEYESCFEESALKMAS